jgi:transcriptional regulator with XRE-family HTH domain
MMTREQLKSMRKRLRLSQRALGERLGMTRTSIARYEYGHIPIPRTVELACAAIALGLSEYPSNAA